MKTPPEFIRSAMSVDQEHSLKSELSDLKAEVTRLRTLINTPAIDNFLEAVRLEAAHQQERWGTEHDEGKTPADWLWLIGWLTGKAVMSLVKGDRDKGLHHIVTSAAALLNWHRQETGEADAKMRPGIETPKGEAA